MCEIRSRLKHKSMCKYMPINTCNISSPRVQGPHTRFNLARSWDLSYTVSDMMIFFLAQASKQQTNCMTFSMEL